jgi:hypothetical protein
MPEEIRVTEPLDRLAALLMQAPTPICVTRGPTHRVEIMNVAFETMAGVTAARGRPFSEIDSGLGGKQLQLMERAFCRGERLEAPEVALTPGAGGDADGPPAGQRMGPRFFNLVYEPLHDRAGGIDGLMISAVDVSSHVASRRDFESAQRRALALPIGAPSRRSMRPAGCAGSPWCTGIRRARRWSPSTSGASRRRSTAPAIW